MLKNKEGVDKPKFRATEDGHNGGKSCKKIVLEGEDQKLWEFLFNR